MTSNPAAVAVFELDCTDCSFDTTILGEYDAVRDEIDAHQQDRGAEPADHFVTVHRRE